MGDAALLSVAAGVAAGAALAKGLKGFFADDGVAAAAAGDAAAVAAVAALLLLLLRVAKGFAGLLDAAPAGVTDAAGGAAADGEAPNCCGERPAAVIEALAANGDMLLARFPASLAATAGAGSS